MSEEIRLRIPIERTRKPITFRASILHRREHSEAKAVSIPVKTEGESRTTVKLRLGGEVETKSLVLEPGVRVLMVADSAADLVSSAGDLAGGQSELLFASHLPKALGEAFGTAVPGEIVPVTGPAARDVVDIIERSRN